jgi:hypothetical protein
MGHASSCERRANDAKITTQQAAMSRRNERSKIRRQVSASIEADVLNHAVVTIPAKDWDAFKAWIAGPAETIPALAELARRRDFCT